MAGSPKRFTGLPIPQDTERFWSRAEIGEPNECWHWKGAPNSAGYGSVTFVWQGKSRNFLAHRVAVAVDDRDIPEGMVVDHICRNRMCVNPAHLRVVDMKTNCLENSASLPAKNVAKTHCKRGHSYDSPDVRRGKDGARHCNACRRQKRAEGFNPERASAKWHAEEKEKLRAIIRFQAEMLERAKKMILYYDTTALYGDTAKFLADLEKGPEDCA